MGFSLNEKIENIRQKPEHIRMRYVWFWVAFSMIFIFLIWIFSVKENFRSVNFKGGELPEVNSPIPNIKEGLPSMENIEQSLQNEIGNSNSK